MPRSWHDRHAIKDIENQEDVELYRNIVADKKPYFMRYIYPDLMKQYNTYIRNTNRNALREFQMDIEQLKAIPHSKMTARQKEFLKYYEIKMPVGTNDCIMNKICRRFEEEFDGYIGRFNSSAKFDYSILRNQTEYPVRLMNAIKQLYDEYNRRIKNYSIFASYERIDKLESAAELSIMNAEFEQECIKICPNRDILSNIIIDICYSRSSTKRFAWSMCGEDIIKNLLMQNNKIISYPTLHEQGDIKYGGNTFKLESKELEVI